MAFRTYVVAAVALAILVCGSSAASAHMIDSCGKLDRYLSCLLFWPFDYSTSFAFPDSLSGVEPGIYHITADVYEDTLTCGSWHSHNRLRNITIQPCVPDTFGCGRIQHLSEDLEECYLWRSLRDDTVLWVDDLDGFQEGDVVLATGILCPVPLCMPVPTLYCDGGFVYEMQLLTCPDSLNRTLETSWGRIKSTFR